MLKLIETLRAKPSDRNIRIIRIVFATILLGVLYFGFPKTSFEYSAIPKEVLYALYIFPIIGLVRGILDPGIMRRKLWKWTQVSLGVTMMIVSLFFIETDTSTRTDSVPSSASGWLSATEIVNRNMPTPGGVDTDFWVGFLGFWLAISGLIFASKNITTKNERYGEKVTKIRV